MNSDFLMTLYQLNLNTQPITMLVLPLALLQLRRKEGERTPAMNAAEYSVQNPSYGQSRRRVHNTLDKQC